MAERVMQTLHVEPEDDSPESYVLRYGTAVSQNAEGVEFEVDHESSVLYLENEETRADLRLLDDGRWSWSVFRRCYRNPEDEGVTEEGVEDTYEEAQEHLPVRHISRNYHCGSHLTFV